MIEEAFPETPAFPATPPELLVRTCIEDVVLDDRTFRIERPIDSDRLLGDPAVVGALPSGNYIPYWTDLWPASRMLAKWILRQNWPPGLTGLEIGCGLGLPGLAALTRGVDVTFSDYDATALEFVRRNARHNGLPLPKVLQLDWYFPPQSQFPILLAADLIYELRNIPPLIRLIKQMLAPVGVCLLTDQDRVPSSVLKQKLSDEGLPFTTQMLRAGEPGGTRYKGTLYRITQPGGRDPLL